MRTEFRVQGSWFRVQGAGFRVQGLGGRGQGGRDPGRWIALFAVLLAGGCASPKVPQFTDADWVSHTTTGRGCYERGDYRRGADAYGRAQQRARALDDAEALAVAAVNRATCLLAEGDAAGARAAVQEALADSRVSAERRAELETAGARAELALGRPEEALSRAGAVLKPGVSAVQQAQARLVQSAARLALKDSVQAAQVLDALPAKEWSRLPASLRAEAAERRAQIAEAEQKPAAAKDRLDQAAVLWKEAGRLPEMARALAAGGRQAEAAGDLAGACDRFWRASRSLWAQGFSVEAVRLLEEGVACAERLEDENIARKLAELLVTFRNEQRLEQ